MHATAHRRGRQTFTLIELLVVVAIIAILAAMLLPVLSKTRGRMTITSCINNLKQAGGGLSMYGGDFEEYPTNYASNMAPSFNYGDECAGLWTGRSPSSTTESYWPGGILVSYPATVSSACDLLINAKYGDRSYLACGKNLKNEPSKAQGGWYFNGPYGSWDNSQTGNYMYNGPMTVGTGTTQCGVMCGLSAVAGMYWDTPPSNGNSWGVSYKRDTVVRPGKRYAVSAMPLLGCPSMYRNVTNGDYREPHHLGARTMTFSGNGAGDNNNGWLERCFLFGDGHARLVYAPVRGGYTPTE